MDPVSGEGHEFIRRALPYEDEGAKQVRQLRSLGVTEVVQISKSLEPKVRLGSLCHGVTSINSDPLCLWPVKDHSRRVLDRAMKSNSIRVTVQPARYSSFDPDRWWETRDGVRTEIIALQKLLLDVVLHPMSF